MIGVTSFKKAPSPNVFSVLAYIRSSSVVFWTESTSKLILSAKVMFVSRSDTDRSSNLSAENHEVGINDTWVKLHNVDVISKFVVDIGTAG